MWFPTQDEAVELYARFLAARHGSGAERHARRTAERLQAEGDHAGHAIWSRVADAVEQSKAKEPRRALTWAPQRLRKAQTLYFAGKSLRGGIPKGRRATHEHAAAIGG